MSESKILKARCRKTGAQFGMELREYGGEWKIVNMIKMEDCEADSILSEVRQPKFHTHTNLIPCQKCGSRVVGGCACAKVGATCTKEMKYKFSCIYCDEFEINYSRKRTPYTSWAGVSNIPGATKDSFGNPSGSEFDLAQDGAFEGYTIIVLNLVSQYCTLNQPQAALEKKGFKLIEYKEPPAVDDLKRILRTPNSQLWVISGANPVLSTAHIDAIEAYYMNGYGVYIWGDNNPFYADANALMSRLFRTQMSGDRLGDKVLGIQQSAGEPGIVANHPITTGLVNFYEGITIAEITLNNGLEPLMYGSEKQIVTAFYDKNQRRAIVDGGFTRLYFKWDSAGTDRYVVNAAAWLTNIERFGY